MSDLIRRDEILAKECCGRISANDVRQAPAVDAVEVVRCFQCQHWKKDVAGCTDLDFIGRCELANYFVRATGYCVYGEMREENAVD